MRLRRWTRAEMHILVFTQTEGKGISITHFKIKMLSINTGNIFYVVNCKHLKQAWTQHKALVQLVVVVLVNISIFMYLTQMSWQKAASASPDKTQCTRFYTITKYFNLHVF